MTVEKKDVGRVILDKRGSVAQLTLSRPEALNALTWQMYEQLEEHLENLEEDSSVRVLIIRGDKDKALAAGTDISQFKGFSGEDGVNYEKRIDRVMNKLEQFSKPTIAAVNGVAVGGGMLIATTCDLRYSTSKSRFGAPMARTLGNCLSLDNYQRLVNEVGPMRTKEMLYTARLISAEEALTLGFLTDLFEEEHFFEKVLEIATKISEKAPLTIQATKRAFTFMKNSNEGNSNQEYEKIISKVYGSKDFTEGVTAYLEKRKPVWRGE